MTSLAIANEQTTFREILAQVEKAGKLTSLSLDQVSIDGEEDDMLALSKVFRGE
jgi:hypothetical protein